MLSHTKHLWNRLLGRKNSSEHQPAARRRRVFFESLEERRLLALANLYVNNQSNPNSISAFVVEDSGDLTPIAGSPFPAGGNAVASAPMDTISVDQVGGHVYAANYIEGAIYGYTIQAGGGLSPVPGSPVVVGANISGVTVDPLGRFVYAANTSGESIAVYGIAPTGQLSFLGSTSTGNGVWSIEAHPSGDFVYTVAYAGGAINGYSVSGAGALTPIAGTPLLGPTNAHGSEVTKDGKFLYVNDAGSQRLFGYAINPTTGGLTAIPGSPFVGSGANYFLGVAANPSGTFIYGSSTAHQIIGASIAANGAVSSVPGSPFAPPSGLSYLTGFVVSPNGSHLYAANSGAGQLYAYDIAANGSLTLRAGGTYSHPAAGAVGVALYALPQGTLNATLSADALTITDTDPTGKNNQFTISTDGADLIIADSVEQFSSVPSGWVFGPGNTSIRRALAGFTGSITVNGALGNDTLTIDNSLGDVIPNGSISFNGGAGGTDTLVFTGGTTTSQTFNFTNNTDGSVVLAGALAGTVNYTGLEPVSSTINATDVILNYSDVAETITMTANGAQTQVDSDVGGEVVSFNNPTGTLQIFAGSGADAANDVININGFGPGLNAALTINGQGGADTINLNAAGLTATTVNLAAETIAQTQGLAASGTTTLDAGTAGTITLTNTSNALATVSVTSAGTASLLDNGGFDLGISNVTTALTLSSSAAITQSGVLSGGALLTKSGTGTLTLTAANTYSGGMTVNASSGSVIATVNTAQNSLGTGTVSIGAGSTVQLNNTNTSGSTVTIGNTFTGTGLLRLNFAAGGSARNTSMQNVTGFGGTIQLSNAGTNADKWNVVGVNAPNASVVINNNSQMFPNGAVSTFAAVSAIGTGNTENRGAIRLTGSLIAPLTLMGNTTIGAENGILNGTIATGVAGTSTLTVGTSNSNTFPVNMLNGVISNGVGTLALHVFNQNSGTIFISGASANTYSGGTTLLHSSSGTRLNIGSISGSPYGTGAITIGAAATDRAGILFTTANQTLANPIIFNTALGTDRPGVRADATGIVLSGTITANLAAATFSTNNTGGIRLNGQVTGGQGLTLDNTFGTTITVTLGNAAGTNNYAGNTNIAGTKGVLVLAAANQIPNGAGAGNLVNNGQFNLGGFSEQINGLSGTGFVDGISGTPTLTLGDNNATGDTFSGVIRNTAGALAITKIGAGMQTLSGANTYTGATTVNAGTLAAGVVSVAGISGAFGNNSAVTMANVAGAVLDITGFDTQIGSLTGGGATGGNVTLGAATLTVGGNNTSPAAYAGVISGTGGLTKIGAGTLTLSGINTFTGGTTVDGGTLALTPGGNELGRIRGALTINSGGTVAANASWSLGWGTSQVVSTIDINGGALNFTGTANSGGTVASTITMTGGTLSGSNFDWYGSLTATPSLVTIASATSSTISSGFRIRENVTSVTLDVGDGAVTNDLVVSGNIIQSMANRALTKTGLGTALLSGANTYTGATTVNAGTLAAGVVSVANVSGAFGNNSAVTVANVAGATLDITGFNTQIGSLTGGGATGGNVTLGAATLTVGGNNTSPAAYAGAISGTGALTKIGTGTLTLSGNSSYGGGTTLSQGTLVHASNNATGSTTAPITIGDVNTGVDNTTLRFTAGLINNNTSTTYKPITVANVGGTTTFEFNQGAAFANINIATSKAITLTTSGGGSQFGMMGSISGTGAGAGNTTVTITNTGGATFYYTAGYSGSGVVANSYAGNLAINGNVNLQNLSYINAAYTNGVIPDTASVTVGAGATWTQVWGGETIDALNGSGGLNNGGLPITVGASNGGGTFTGALSGAGTLTKIGTGTQTLSGSLSYAGLTTINNGTLNFTNSTTTGGVTINSPGIMELNRTVAGFASRIGFTGTISGNGTVNVNSAANTSGTTTDGGWYYFRDTVSLTGQINVNSGVFGTDFTVANWSATTAGVNVAANAVFTNRGNSIQIGALTGSGTVTPAWSSATTHVLTIGAGGASGSFTGAVRGSNSGGDGTINAGVLNIAKIGAGTQQLTGANVVYTGNTTVSGGTLRFTDTTALNTSIANSSIVEINAASAGDSWILLVGKTLSGNGVWNKTGPGRATLRNVTVTTSGQFNVTAGTLRNDQNSSNWAGNTADMDISGGAILDLYADAIFVNRLTGTGFVQNGYGNASGQSGASAFIERLVVGVNGGTSTFDGVIRNNSTNTTPASATAGGGVQLEKFGAGTTTLTGTNNYSGVTLVTAGTLLVNGTHTGTGAVTASNSAVLGGTGSLAATVTMNNTSRLSPGTSPETLASGSLTLTSGSFFDVEIGGTAPGDGVTGYDQLNVTGTVSLGNATLNLQQILGFTVNSGVAQAYTIITNDGSDAVNGTFFNQPEGSPIAYAGGTLYVSYAGNDGNDVVLYSQPTVNGSANADAIVLRQVAGDPALVEFSLNAAPFVQVTSTLPFLFNGNLGTDLLWVDTSNGDPISTGDTTFNGELLRVQKNTGAASDTVTYVPSAVAGTGAVTHAMFGNVNFTQTTNVDFVNLTTVNIQTATANDTLTIADGNTATNGAAVPAGYSIAAAAKLSIGGANAIVGLRTVTNSNLDTVTGGGNGNDSVSINSGTGAHGNTNLTIGTGVGTDTVTVAGALTVGGNLNIGSQSIAVNATLTGGAAGTATLNAGTGAITTSGTGIDVVIRDLSATATLGIDLDTNVLNITAVNSGAGNINLDEANGANLLSVSAANGASTVTTATGNLHVTSVAASTLVTLTVAAGAITDANAGANNISGAALVLTAAAGVAVLADPLESSVANLEASGGVGGVFVSNAGGLTIGSIGATVGVSATGGGIVVATTGALTVTENVTATGAGTGITLTAVDAPAAGQNLVLNGGVTVSSAAASVTLNAGDNATIIGNVSSGTLTTINVDAGDAESAGPTATAGDGGTLSITGIITTPNTAAGGTFLNGGNDYDTFIFNPQTTTAFYVDGDLPVGGTVGDTLQMNVTGTVNPNLTVPGDTTVFNGKTYNGPGSGVWTFDPNHREVRFKSLEDAQVTGDYHLTYDNSVAPVGNLVVMLDGTASPNEKLQFRDTTAGGTVLYQTTLTPILSVRVLGGALADVVTIDDVNGLPSFGGDVPGSTGVGDNPFTSDTGPTAPPEFYFDAGGGVNVLNFNLNQASTQQQYAIGTGTGPGTSEGEVQSTNAVAGLNAYFRGVSEVNRTGNGATPGGLTVFGDNLANVISIAANGAESRVAATGYVPFDFSGNNFSAITVNAQAGADTLDLINFGTSQTNSPLITLNGNTEDDTIRVRSTSGNTNTVTLNGNAGNDLFQLFDSASTVDNIAGPVIVDGTDGNVANNTDTLTIVDSGDGSGDSVVISAVNAGASADYAVEGINGVGGNDVVFRNVDVLNYTGTADADTIDGRFVNTTPVHDLSMVSLSGWLGADQFLLFTSDQLGGSGAGFTPSGSASGVANISLYGDTPGNTNPDDGLDTFGETHPDIVGLGGMNVGLVVPDTYRLIRPSATTSISIDGGEPTGLAAPLGDVAGDTHNLDISALPNTTPVVVSTFGPGTVVATGIAPIVWTQIENINLVDQGKLTNVQMGDLFARTTPAADLVQIMRNPTALNPNQIRLRITATIGNYSASNKTIIYGGGLNDTITQSNLTIPAEFYGEDGDDYLTGAMNNDWLVGGIGNDRINGSGGDNVIWGDNSPTNPGDLTPQDGAVGGDDQLSGLGGNDVFYGGAGNDQISAGDGNDYANGGQGNDTLDGHGGDDRLYGGAGDDVLSGGTGSDLLSGGADDDKLYADSGNDVLFGGTGVDLLDAGGGNDLLVSGSVANEASSFTSLANTATFSAATYTNPTDNDAALLTLVAQWAIFGNRGTLGTSPAITHDGVKDELFGGLGDDDFCWEVPDVLPGVAPSDYNAFGHGTDERFGPT